MKRVSILGLCLVALFAISAVGASSAFAGKPEFVAVKGAFPFHFEGNDGEGKLVATSGATIACGKIDTLGFILNAHLGDFLILFLLCKGPLLTTCTTPGMLAGHIHVRGTFHLGMAMKGAEEVHAILLGIEETKFACGGLQVTVKGSVIGKITEPVPVLKTNTSNLQLTFKQTGGTQEFVEFLLGPLEGLMNPADLEAKMSGGFELAGQESVNVLKLLAGNEIKIE